MWLKILPKMKIGRLTISVMAFTFAVVAGLLIYTGFSSDNNSISVYGADSSDALELRGSVFARCGESDYVKEIVYTVAIPEDSSPVNFSAPPSNVINISYSDEDQQVAEIPWTVKEYVGGDGDSILESGETFLVTTELPVGELKVDTAFVIEIQTPDNEILSINRTTPDYLEPVMNLE